MSRKVILYIAVSLDGYIADSEGKIDWLGGQDENYEGDYGYGEFISDVDTVVMGMNTYQQITTELSPEKWPYENKRVYVFTHREMDDGRNLAFIQKNAEKFMAELKLKQGKNIWICGGADLANQFMKAGLIDEYHLTIMPVILGKGIPLFSHDHPEIRLQIERVQEIHGVIDIVYSNYH